MGSRAFAAVARAVHFVMEDPDEDGARLVGQPKNNLGRTDLETLRFAIEEQRVGDDADDGLPILAPRIRWLGSTHRSVGDVLADITGGGKPRTRRDEAAEWLVAYLATCPDGRHESEAVKAAASRAGHSIAALHRARQAKGVSSSSEGFPRARTVRDPRTASPPLSWSSQGGTARRLAVYRSRRAAGAEPGVP
jgi:hypothetical protein